MKIKLAVIMGMAALGLAQGQVMRMPVEREFNRGEQRVSWQVDRGVEADGVPTIEAWEGDITWMRQLFPDLPLLRRTFTSTASFEAYGGRVWQTANNYQPPDGFVVNPPTGNPFCQRWPGRIRTNWGKDPDCSPLYPSRLNYFVEACSGSPEYIRSWTDFIPFGNCESGLWASNPFLVLRSRDCPLAMQPTGDACETCDNATLHFSGIPSVCFTTPQDTGCVRELNINFTSDSLNDSGSGVDSFYGFPYTWTVTATPAANNTYDLRVRIQATDTVCGSGQTVEIDLTQNWPCGVNQAYQVEDTDCAACHQGNGYEPGFRCSTAFCDIGPPDPPYAICNHDLVLSRYIWGMGSISINYY
jgi:hypothetical protein